MDVRIHNVVSVREVISLHNDCGFVTREFVVTDKDNKESTFTIFGKTKHEILTSDIEVNNYD